VQLAYCDPQGVTRAFILNGLQHAKRVLDEHLERPERLAGPSTPLASAAGVTCSSWGGESSNGRCSIVPEHFEYFSVYNEELGRHEAYYQALQDTVINIPAGAEAGAASSVAADNTQVDEQLGDYCSNKGGSQDTEGEARAVSVAISAGELLHVEYSHKYSHKEVLALADVAGLQWEKAWTDSQQQYNLHMFSLPCK
jgi:uncharacterized SAM-dependent methyltransferase